MSVQQTSHSTIIISRILSTLSSIIGYALAIFFGIGLIFGSFSDITSIVIILIFLAIAAALIIHGIRTSKRIKRFKRYISIISVENQTSLETIASTCSQSIDFVTNDLQKMIDKKFFTTAYIDKNTNEIVLQKKNVSTTNASIKKDTNVEFKVVTCKGCGASNSIPKNTMSECEFCGSMLDAK